MPERSRPRDIDARGRTLRELLARRKYSIDYYQREYRWQRKQVAELLDDLTGAFLEDHAPGNERAAVADYRQYFLGSVILSDREGERFIVDGQQRLTTLTLLLTFLHQGLAEPDQKAQVSDLIFSTAFGRRSFNLDVPERVECMEALYAGTDFVAADAPESVETILERYADIEELFPEELRELTLPFFADWLMEKVQLVEITAFSDEDAYRIFETMNDRGLSLTPSEMLKGYLLANIADPDERGQASRTWKARTEALADLGKDEGADAIKAWLRGQHAQSIRERHRGAIPKDFDLIGTEFHRWVRDHAPDLGLTSSGEFVRLIARDFRFYTGWFERLRRAAERFEPGLASVYHNAQHNLTLQYPVILATLRIDDDETRALRKIRVTGAYLDILINRRIWNFRAIDYSTIQYAMFLVMREIRGQDVGALVDVLAERLDADTETFAANERFRLHGTNGRQIHRMLARMTDYVETQSGQESRYAEYAQRGRRGYEIEHIWANHPERHTSEFAHPQDFAEYRNRIGGLVLLPKSFNASYGDLSYPDKRDHYRGQNLLASSLHEATYSRNPGFNRFIDESGLGFRPHEEFRRADLDARQELYQRIAEVIWSPDRLSQEASS